MLQALCWVIFLLALTRGAWLAFAPQQCLDDRRRRWQTGAAHAIGITDARQPR
jgi:cytochrome b561